MKIWLRTTAAVIAAAQGAAALAQDSLVLDEILVESASRDPRALLDTPVAVTVLSGEQLAVKQATDFQQLIGDAPGLTIEGGPRSIAQEPNIRGFQDEQVVLRFDGGRSNFDQAHRGRFFVDPDIVERVEIVRGGGSTLFGSRPSAA
jgi:hemoglobin/transferrin/lactoferrin receptor protein